MYIVHFYYNLISDYLQVIKHLSLRKKTAALHIYFYPVLRVDGYAVWLGKSSYSLKNLA